MLVEAIVEVLQLVDWFEEVDRCVAQGSWKEGWRVLYRWKATIALGSRVKRVSQHQVNMNIERNQ